MHTYTITYTDTHAHTVQFVGIIAQNRITALWYCDSNQIVQAQVATILLATDTWTVTVVQTA